MINNFSYLRAQGTTHTVYLTHHQYVGDCLEELHELSEAVVAELALTTEVMVVGGDELTEGHSTVRLVTKKVHHLLPKLLSALHFLHCTLCREIRGNSVKLLAHCKDCQHRLSYILGVCFFLVF